MSNLISHLLPFIAFILSLLNIIGMKKSKNYQSSGKRIVKNTASKNDSVPPKLDSVDEDDQGFGGWLRYKWFSLIF